MASATLAEGFGGKKYHPQHLRKASVGKDDVRNLCGSFQWEKMASATFAEASSGKKYHPQPLRKSLLG